MSVPTIVVHGLQHKARIRDFFKQVQPHGASIQFSGKYPTWLLKPTSKGGTTIGRIIDASGKDEVHDLISAEWQIAEDAYKAKLRKELDAFDKEYEADKAAGKIEPPAPMKQGKAKKKGAKS